MENKSVKYSRAGDVFHYRWAARRCLRLIYPKSRLRYVVIEGSNESRLSGEYVIDVTEYRGSEENEIADVSYFQLKHTTVRKDKPFVLSDLKDTIEGFGSRYSDLLKEQGSFHRDSLTITFTVVTNRPVSEALKQQISNVANGNKVNSTFQTTIEKYTKLSGLKLAEFCSLLQFVDGEGDYNAQKYELHAELSQLLAGTIDDPQLNNLIALVQDKALPDNDGKIYPEDILQRLGASSEKDLFPAPPEFQRLSNLIRRKQHDELQELILNTSEPVIIHAEGGVGKSVFALQVVQALPSGSVGIVYDCFGGGRYRNRSEPRHRHRDALIQISNELASRELCAPFVPRATDLDDQILRGFLARLKTAVNVLRSVNRDSVLVILLDAADNAEMAAEEFSEPCFAHELLREAIPDGCRLIALCRSERVHLLHPLSTVVQRELKPFSVQETLSHLRSWFPNAIDEEGLEFHRLTNDGNPRVQANALSLGFPTVGDVLAGLGPIGTTVDKQIEAQLESAISRIKDKFPIGYRDYIDSICLGLANLPPFIPIKVLARAANVDQATVKSFVADLGRPLWITDTSVQFRDEPTETWFRQTFSATTSQISTYISRLEPLAAEYAYVAETLPLLLLNAGKYSELIDLALSDNFLPEENPIDKRNVRVFRLKFAFKAALKSMKYADATRLSLRAGEEVAGDKRQLELLTKNVDLIAPLQYEQKVQELAFRRLLRSEWDGSENVYSSALLSSVENFKGEARGYLRAAFNWLHLYFEKREKEENNHFEEKLNDNDIVELTSAISNLDGIEKAVNFVLSWTPPDLIYRISKKFVRRFLDANKMELVDEIVRLSYSEGNLGFQYLMMAIAQELVELGRFPDTKATRKSLNLLVSKKTRIPRPAQTFSNTSLSALVSLLEACAANKHSKAKILRVLNHYVPKRGSRSVGRDFQKEERETYLRAVALRCVLEGDLEPEITELLPKDLHKKKKNVAGYDQQEVREFKENVGGLLPWYLIRARVLVHEMNGLFDAMSDADKSSKSARSQGYRASDALLYEISHVLIDILILWRNTQSPQVEKFLTEFINEKQQIWIEDRIRAVRTFYRSEHLLRYGRQLEVSARQAIEKTKAEHPTTRAEWYIDLARAVLSISRDDSATYFSYAVEAVSKFGDELVQRWQAIAALGRRSAAGGNSSAELAYRFIRCAELVGDNVDREKHWDRHEAVRVCTALSPVSALAALSRWRDRDVGTFERQIRALAHQIVNDDCVTAAAGWPLSAFFEDYGLEYFAINCIEKEPDAKLRQSILTMAVNDLRLQETGEETWTKLKQTAKKYSIENLQLDEVVAFYAKKADKKVSEVKKPFSGVVTNNNEKESSWDTIFSGLELTVPLGIRHARNRFSSSTKRVRSQEDFWKQVIQRVGDNDAVKFLEMIIEDEASDWLDVMTIFSALPKEWRQKISVQSHWERLFERIGKRFAVDFLNHWSVDYFLEKIQNGKEMKSQLQRGVLVGLSSSIDISDADSFFGFAEIVAPFITHQEATSLLDYALARLEMHIDPEYGDGNWDKWLEPPKDITVAFTGLIWSALGSPRSEIRWRAAHCVRRLAETGCQKEIDHLIEWMNRNEIGGFGSKDYPFYSLHARLYLLIALARISLEHPKILKRHSAIFSRLALEDMHHILIQKFAADIAFNIEKAYPRSYRKDTMSQLKGVGLSKLPVKIIESGGRVGDGRYAGEEVDGDLKFYHGYDFDRYWYEPLAEVFGISRKQVQELATKIIINELKADRDGSYTSDPRVALWQSTQNERETWHDHGSYPRTDNYSFYFSYHAMFIVAARLLEKMPVVRRRNWDEDEDQWLEWLHRHMLTRSDGKWLADRRDPAPLARPQWTETPNDESWRSAISNQDFLDVLVLEHEGNTWLNVYGYWSEGYSNREEKLHIATALVSPAGSQSLVNAWTTCSDPHDFKIPEYEEERMEFDTEPFRLKGWIWSSSRSKRLDELDPFAANIAYPPYQLGESMIEKMGLLADAEQRRWFLHNTDRPQIVSEIWSTKKPRWDEDPMRHGERVSASLAFLQELCKTFQCNIIIDVEIERRYSDTSYIRNEKDNGYQPPQNKIFILTGDGKLRDTEAYYQTR